MVQHAGVPEQLTPAAALALLRDEAAAFCIRMQRETEDPMWRLFLRIIDSMAADTLFYFMTEFMIGGSGTQSIDPVDAMKLVYNVLVDELDETLSLV